jgi:hypothetical protein
MSAETAIEFQIRPRESAPILIPGAIARWIRGSAFGVQFQELPVHESRSLTPPAAVVGPFIQPPRG